MTCPLSSFIELLSSFGAVRFYAKPLAANDNSKNQVYLGGGFGALNIIPHGSIKDDVTHVAGSVRDRAKAPVNFFWVTSGKPESAPDAQLILYPKYPEVRMSGFLRGTKNGPNSLMTSRAEGRVLILGICDDGRVLGDVFGRDHPAAIRLSELAGVLSTSGVFLELTQLRSGVQDTRAALLAALKNIYDEEWIASCKIGKSGQPEPYSARNGGGYTLEAKLGISPNGYAEPDFLGWELKQYGVRDFERYIAKSPVTLMTPEPTGGFYRDAGVEAFLRRFGYPDKSGKKGRINFGGVYTNTKEHHPDTGLALRLEGFDAAKGKIEDLDGCIVLVDKYGEPGATWSFRDIMAHWNRKHAKAAYVPSIMKSPPPFYKYGGVVQLCEETDVLLLLKAIAAGSAYYDPGIKMEKADSKKPLLKRRSQFRIKHSDLSTLYRNFEEVAL
ncbi:MvaI/BcnI family restriction endonuclease [Ruegeria sp. HKCCA4812]|uniref:MvaI/BcnI family restriction endonuclease n=1 Tax=Ruegeria sp. HKCCA4812 TaxID=2682993 RepID=UPI001489A910|nr:MvaI/BcnI family restriction endonuclease [Ruegeria sp. HKCCA4812]